MENVNVALSQSTLQKINKPFILGMLLFSFIGVYLGFFERSIYLLTSFALTGAIFILFIECVLNDPRINGSSLAIFFIVCFSLVISILYNRSFPSAHIFLIFLCLLYAYFGKNQMSEQKLIDITNYTFVVYVILSVLVNIHLLPIGREANTHEEYFLSIKVNSFVGFFGSTAHIDSYSIVVLLINYFLNRKHTKKYYVILASFVAFITFRTTPLLVLFGSIVAVYIIEKLNWKLLKVIAVLVIFLSFLLPLAVFFFTNDRFYVTILDYLLTGRASLWLDIFNLYQKEGFWDQLIGFGAVEKFTVYTWGFEKSNPHNLYLNFMILYGYVIFIPLFIFICRKFLRMTYNKKIIFLAILLGGVGNSAIIGFTNLPITLWFAYLLSNESS